MIKKLPHLTVEINQLIERGVLEVVTETVTRPGLYHLGDVYLYPSRLEGIGLTIAEALSCGLPVVVPDNGPMNEFAEEHSKLVAIDQFISRSDGYYWPECIPNIDSLRSAMESYLDIAIVQWPAIRRNTRNNAIKKFDWNTNSASLYTELQQVEVQAAEPSIVGLATKIDNQGRPRFTNHAQLYNLLYRVLKR